MSKVWGRPIHGVICREEEIEFIIRHRAENKSRAHKLTLDYKFSEDELEELCRP